MESECRFLDLDFSIITEGHLKYITKREAYSVKLLEVKKITESASWETEHEVGHGYYMVN